MDSPLPLLRERPLNEMNSHDRSLALAWAFGGQDEARLQRERESLLWGYAPRGLVAKDPQ